MITLGTSFLTTFRPFTTFHLVTAVIGLSVIMLVCMIGRHLRGTLAEPRFRFALATLILLEQLAAYATWLGRADQTWIPLHPCRIVVWIAIIALLSDRRAPRAILYFWSLSVCCQPILTPPRLDGLRSPDFWFFWISHLAIFGAGMYEVRVRRFRPTVRDLRTTAIWSLLYIAIVIPLDYAYGWDYAYLGRGRYKTHNVTDLFAPGPPRTIALIFITALLMTLLLLIWRLPPLARRIAVAAPAHSP